MTEGTTEGQASLDKSTPAVRRGRKARNLDGTRRDRPVAEGGRRRIIGDSNPPDRWHVLVALGSEGFSMQAIGNIANSDGPVLAAPERLISATRGDFRSAALQHIDQLGDAASAMVIDLTQTIEIDTSGLGMLVFVQKRAKERGFSTILRRAPERVRNLLKLTLLEFLFEFRD